MKHKLYGDGLHDDTSAIQDMIDSTPNGVNLPMPEVCYILNEGQVKYASVTNIFENGVPVELKL